LVEQCLLLVGGLGTRLGEIGKNTPKPLLPVAGAPFVEILIGEARRRGVRRFILLAGHMPEKVAELIVDRELEKRFDCQVDMLLEPRAYGTGGAVAHAYPYVDDEFFLLNGDTWFDFNWLDLATVARRAGAEAALSLRAIAKPDRYEVVTLEGDRVSAILPRRSERKHGLINGGVYYLTKRAIEDLRFPSSLEADLLPALVARGALAGKAYDGFFIDIGIPETLKAAEVEVPRARKRPAVFLDRDGVINVDSGYTHSHEGLQWIPGAKEAVKRLNDAGFFVFVVTNQAGVAKGLYEESHVVELHDWMGRELNAAGATIDDWRYSPYHPDGVVEAYAKEHAWRKPGPGMLVDLMEHWPVDRGRSFLIGDRESDIQAATAAGVPGFLFEGGNLETFLEGLPLYRAVARA
jgi:D,D-heptose 1,7-bisphosphate phosphatase